MACVDARMQDPTNGIAMTPHIIIDRYDFRK